jgi:two-component system OmpR family response regulator
VLVLVVEEERTLAAGLRSGLEAEGFAVDVAHTGTEGLWLATEHPYDAIVLDLQLPGLNGYQVCEQLRARKVRTPVLALTPRSADHDALDPGADDYLAKPFADEVLVARLRALLRRPPSEGP